MAGIVVRAVVAAALLITWLLPSARLSVLPRERALALAADAVCWAEGSAVLASLRTTGAADTATRAPDPRLAEMATLFEPATTRQWAVELARVAFAALAVGLLLSRWRFAPALVIAAAILYLT